MSKKREPNEFSKGEKINYLRRNGWYEVKESNNWIDGKNIPKKWKGVSLDKAFEKFYSENKKKVN